MRFPETNSAVPASKCRAKDPSGGPSRSRLTIALTSACSAAPGTASSTSAPISSTAPSTALTSMASRNSRSVRRAAGELTG